MPKKQGSLALVLALQGMQGMSLARMLILLVLWSCGQEPVLCCR